MTVFESDIQSVRLSRGRRNCTQSCWNRGIKTL